MRRTIRKTISFLLATMVFMTVFTNNEKVFAEEENKFFVQTIIENKYDDVVTFGDGYLFLENGKFDDIRPETKFIFVDENGNERIIENKYGFTEAFFNVSDEAYCLEYQTLIVKKDNKVALMDENGELFGGNNNFYSCIVSAGENLFYTTDATENSSNKGDTFRWTLRKKDGTVIKELYDFNIFTERYQRDGLEYLLYSNGKETELISIDENYNIRTLGTGYSGISIYGTDKYIIAKGGNGEKKSITIFNNDGTKKFEVEGYDYIYIEDLEEKGYAKVFRYSDDEYPYGKCNIVDSNGNLMFDEGNSYSEIKDFDDKVALVLDKDNNIYLVDYNNNTLFDSKKYCEDLGEGYYIYSYDTYLKNSMLAFTIKQYNEYGTTYRSMVLDNKGDVILDNIDGDIQQFDGKYIIFNKYDGEIWEWKYFLIDLKGKVIKESKQSMELACNPEGIIATNEKYYYESDNQILIFEDGREIKKYNTVGYFKNNYAYTWDATMETQGLIDNWGNEIIPIGKYATFTDVKFSKSDWIVAYKEEDENYIRYYPELLHISGETVIGTNNYKIIGEYRTKCNDIRGYGFEKIAGTSINEKYNPLVITVDQNDKIGLIKINDCHYECDVNKDGKVDIFDLTEIAINYGKKKGDATWIASVDINYDNYIDIFDLTIISKRMN